MMPSLRLSMRSEPLLIITAVVLAVFAGLLTVLLEQRGTLLLLAFILAAFLAIQAPEILLVAYVSAGFIKSDPNFAVIFDLISRSLDFTVLLAIALLVSMAVRAQSNFTPTLSTLKKAQVELSCFACFLAVIGLNVIYFQVSGYGLDESLRFSTLTLLSFAAPLVLFRNLRQITIMLWALMALGAALMVFSSTDVSNRLLGMGATAIGTGRVLGSVIIILAAVSLTDRIRSRGFAVVPLMVPPLLGLLLTGSRGPLFSLLAVLALMVLLRSILRTGEGPMPARLQSVLPALATVLLFAVLIYYFLATSSLSQRFDLATMEQNPRGDLFDMALTSFLSSPLLGNGMGSFAQLGLGTLAKPILYPHDMAIEVASETGMLGLAPLAGLLVVSFSRGGSFLRTSIRRGRDVTLSLTICALTLYHFLNTFVSGDLNDQRLFWLFLGTLLWMYSSTDGDNSCVSQ